MSWSWILQSVHYDRAKYKRDYGYKVSIWNILQELFLIHRQQIIIYFEALGIQIFAYLRANTSKSLKYHVHFLVSTKHVKERTFN